jgi:ligand-binding sensor domain-containing protein
MPASRQTRHWSTRLGLCTAPILAIGLFLACLSLAATTRPAQAEYAAQSITGEEAPDGRTFFSQNDGLPANGVTALLGDDRGLWIGTPAGLSYYTTQGRDAGLQWQTYTHEDGMASDQVNDLWQDKTGTLWVAHPDGQISQFDGRSWTTYDSPTQTLDQAYKQIVDASAASPFWSIEQGGRVWTLADDTVGYYVGSVWRPYGEDSGIPRGQLIAVWTGDEGAWVASENGQIGYFDGANWTTFQNPFDAVQRQYETIISSGARTSPMWVVDQDDVIWVRNAFNQRNPRPDVRRFAEGQWTNFSNTDGMADGFVEELRLDKYGRLWVRHAADENGQGGGLSLYLGEPSDDQSGTGRWMSITPAFGGNVTDFWPESIDGVWLGSHFQPPGGGVSLGGLTYVDLSTWKRFPLNTLTGTAISDSWLDEDDNLWLGFASDPFRGLAGGLWRYRPSQGNLAARWTPVQGLLDNDVRDLWGDGAGNLWVATQNGVNHITLNNRKLVSYTEPIDPDRVIGDSEGNVWAVALGEGGGAWEWNGQSWSSHTISDGLGGGAYADALVLSDGDVYLAGDRGLDIYDGKQWKTFSALPGRHLKRIWQDNAGDLWLTSEITPGRPFNLSLNQGSSWETVLNEKSSRDMGPETSALLRDSRGVVWLATPVGLYTYDPDGDARFRGLGPIDGLPTGTVSALFEGADGTIWVAIEDQAYRTDPLTCPQPSIGVCDSWVRFEPQIGLITDIAAGPAASLVFIGDAGVALYQPSQPELKLDGVTNLITGDEVDGSEPVILTLGQNAARIDLLTNAPKLPDREISYRFRMEGIDAGWRLTPATLLGGKQASITYADLPDGVYTFTAVAQSNTLDASPELSLTLLVLSRPPKLFLEGASVAGRPVEEPSKLHSFVEQPIQIHLAGSDDQLQPTTFRYRIEGLGDNWSETTTSEISFSLSSAGTYTFVALALDGDEQSSYPVASQIVVSDREPIQDSTQLPIGTIAAGLAVLAVLFIGSAIVLIIRRRQRESW